MVLVVIGVHRQRHAELPQVIDASDAAPGFLGFAERRQEHAGENGDNRDHHQEFNEGEAAQLRGTDGHNTFAVHFFFPFDDSTRGDAPEITSSRGPKN